MHPTPASAATTGTAALRRVLPWLLLSLALHLPLLHWAVLERDSPFRQWQPFHVLLVDQQGRVVNRNVHAVELARELKGLIR